jgi:hypothetical protein
MLKFYKRKNDPFIFKVQTSREYSLLVFVIIETINFFFIEVSLHMA